MDCLKNNTFSIDRVQQTTILMEGNDPFSACFISCILHLRHILLSKIDSPLFRGKSWDDCMDIIESDTTGMLRNEFERSWKIVNIENGFDMRQITHIRTFLENNHFSMPIVPTKKEANEQLRNPPFWASEELIKTLSHVASFMPEIVLF